MISLQLPFAACAAVLAGPIRLRVDFVASPRGLVCVIGCEREKNVVAEVITAIPAANYVFVGAACSKSDFADCDYDKRGENWAHDTSNELKLSRA
jgi:hypothetical protein